ncbi:MAG: succinylglutamate desuccinylase/aspartoacylase family protein [SAR324 cluster bacterium]|nr:succinylglutamate desuccinylase/aspartoacylase family protein [SAR324 cluster bacterium]
MPEFLMDELSKNYLKVEYNPVDIQAYESGNVGVPYVWSLDSGIRGPHVMICGSMHGNEIAGAAILNRIFKRNLKLSKGKLTFCFGNPAAYHKFDKSAPYLNRFIDTDINRVWGAELTDPGNHHYEVRRARELQTIVDTVDYLFDIHTMQGRGEPVALIQGKPAALGFVSELTEIPFILTGAMHQADHLRLRDYGNFGKKDHHAVAVQLEAGQHWEKSSIDEGETIVIQFLECTGIIPATKKAPNKVQKQLRIVQTILPEGGIFRYAKDFQNGVFFREKGSLIGYAGIEKTEVRTPQDNCYLLMPVHFRLAGGSSGRFAIEI